MPNTEWIAGLSPEALREEDRCLDELRQLNRQRQTDLEERYDTQAQNEPIPDHILPGLARYVTRGIVPGSFMRAMLCNDLAGAVNSADSDNIRKIPAIYGFFYQYIPSAAWGREDKLRKWVQSKQ